VLTIPIERKSSFHWSQYDLLGNLVDDPGGFAIHNSNAITTLAGLAAYARANPGAVTVGTTGTGSDDHLAMLLFAKATGTQLTHVPYKGAGEVRAAATGQQITIGAINVGEVLAYQKGGTPIRLLGQMSAARSSLAPQVPTFKEQGIDIELASLRPRACPKACAKNWSMPWPPSRPTRSSGSRPRPCTRRCATWHRPPTRPSWSAPRPAFASSGPKCPGRTESPEGHAHANL